MVRMPVRESYFADFTLESIKGFQPILDVGSCQDIQKMC
jgi:hypothetical protein